MLKTKWLMLTLSTSLLIITPVKGSITPFQPTTEQSIENKIDNNGMVTIQNPIIKKLEKDKIEFEQKKIKKQIEEQKKNEPQWQEFELTFYSSLDIENYSGCGGKTSTGSKLFDGVVASNYYKINTRIQLQGWGEVTVLDRGSDKYFNNNYKLDVYIPRNPNESDNHYHARVEKMGKVKVKGRIVNE